MKPPREVPAVSPASPVVERTQRIKISLGNKQYVLNIAVKAERLKPPPAPMIEMPAPVVEPDGAAEHPSTACRCPDGLNRT